MWILPLLTLQLATMGIQATEYSLHLGPLKFPFYDKNYISNVHSELFDYNNAKAYNISVTFKHPVASGLLIAMKMFIWQANAYRRIPYQLDINVCDTFRRNDFGIRVIYNISNFRGCPVEANVPYYCNNFVVDPKKLPRGILLPGKFRANLKMFTKAAHFTDMEWFVEIIPEKH